MAYDNRHEWRTGAIDMSSASEQGIFIAPDRVKIHEVGAFMTVVMSSTALPTIQCNKVLNGTAAGSGDGGSLVLAAAQAVGTGVKDTTSTIFPYVLNAGDHLNFTVSTAADVSGTAYGYVKYEIMADVAANRSAYMAESA
jgi:hypothetical protein